MRIDPRLGRLALLALLVAGLTGCANAPRHRSAAPAPARPEPARTEVHRTAPVRTEPTTVAPAPAPAPDTAAPVARSAPEASVPVIEAGPTPSEIERMPEPEPRIEPIRPGGPNKPYVVGGETIVPDTRDEAQRERGRASWYGRPFHGRRTANGEVFNMYAFSAAHRTWPIPSYARVRHLASGRELVVRINDRGPFVRGRMLDLSYAAAVKLGMAGQGSAEVEIERLTHEQIRTGSWRNAGTQPALAAAAPASAGLPATAVATTAATPSAAAALDDRLPGTGVVPVASTAADAAAPAAPSNGSAGGEVRAPSEAPRGFWLQLGAFRDLAGAGNFQQHVQAEIDWLAPLLAIFLERPLYRLQAGPFASRDDANRAAQRLRESLQLVPMLVQRK